MNAALHADYAFVKGSGLCRLAGELLRLSAPQRTRFQPAAATWEDAGGETALGPVTLRAISEALGGAGVSAIDHLLGLRIAHCLRDTFASLSSLDPGAFLFSAHIAGSRKAVMIGLCQSFHSVVPWLAGVQEGVDAMAAALSHDSLANGTGGPAALAEAARKAGPLLEPLQEALLSIGQAVLLRRQLVAELRASFLCAPATPFNVGSALFQQTCKTLRNCRLDGSCQLGDALAALSGTVMQHSKQQGPDKLSQPLSQIDDLVALTGIKES